LTPTLEAEKQPAASRAFCPPPRPASRRATHASILAALVLALLRSTAQAQPSATPPPAPDAQTARDQHARSLFEKGREAYGDGRYRDAWAYFHEAYQLSERPELLYNIGQTADRLGQDSDALRAFRMYLDRLPAAQNRHDVENRIHALEERVGASGQPAPENLSEAQTSAATPFPATPRAPPPLPPLRQHSGPSRKGVYLRGAVGLGLRSDGVSDSDLSANILGFGFAGDLACGYAVLSGFVVGGAIYLDYTSRPTLSIGNQSANLASANLTSIGPFVDWYLNRETSGFHLQGAITLSVLSLSLREGSGLSITNRSATGIGLVVGGGYEWPIAGDWAIGVLARLTLAGLTADTTSHGFVSPSLLASVTWF
jgi:hypothetical protein